VPHDEPGEPVPRETSPSSAPEPPPPLAAELFGPQLSLAEAYAELLRTTGLIRGLIGPREVPRLWERHLLNCAVVSDLLPPASRTADLGSGAGLPGLVLAIRRPDLSVTLVEPLLRRATFLQEAVDQLGLANVQVRRARAEELHGRARFSAVTARAVAPLSRLLGWSMPLVEPGGSLLAMKGSSAEAEVADAADVLQRWDTHAEVLTVGDSVISPPATVVRVVASDRPRLRLPRTSGSAGNRRGSGRRRDRSRGRGPRGDEGRQ
jgi:16S rRNA (guanine527-N7)-methyltransferase